MSAQRSYYRIFEDLLLHYKSPDEIRKQAKAVSGRGGAKIRQKCSHAIATVLDEYSVTNPGKKLNLYQTIKLAKQYLAKNGIKVGSYEDSDKDIDESTLKRHAKTVRIFYYSIDNGSLEFTLDEWKWLATKVFQGKRSQVRDNLTSILSDVKQLRDLKIRSLMLQRQTNVMPDDELNELESKITYWNKVLALFPA